MKKILVFALMLLGTVAFAQKQTVTGRIVDASGNPVPGLTVLEQGTSNGTTTDADGKYSISVSPSSVLSHSVQVYLSNRVTPVVLSLGGTVHGSRRMLRKEFGPYATGDLGLREREYRSADLYRGFCVVELATVANLGRRPLEVGFTNVSDGLEISVTPNPVPPLCTAEMRMTVHSGPSVSGEITSRATPVLNGKVQGGGISVKTRIK